MLCSAPDTIARLPVNSGPSSLYRTEHRQEFIGIKMTGTSWWTTKYIVYFLLGISPASNCSWPTFRNPVSVPSSKAGWKHCSLFTQPLKMELIQGSETSANYNLTPGKYPEENIQYSNHGESLKSRKPNISIYLIFIYKIHVSGR